MVRGLKGIAPPFHSQNGFHCCGRRGKSGRNFAGFIDRGVFELGRAYPRGNTAMPALACTVLDPGSHSGAIVEAHVRIMVGDAVQVHRSLQQRRRRRSMCRHPPHHGLVLHQGLGQLVDALLAQSALDLKAPSQHVEVPAFELRPLLPGLDFLGDLVEAVRAHRCKDVARRLCLFGFSVHLRNHFHFSTAFMTAAQVVGRRARPDLCVEHEGLRFSADWRPAQVV
jgi:hypothetical protein